MGFLIEAISAEKIGFASHQNAVPVIVDLRVLGGGATVENCELRLKADPLFLVSKTWLLDRITGDDEITILDRNLQLNAEFLSGLTEAISATLSLTLVDAQGQELASWSKQIELLASNEWGGIGSMAHLLPAFVMPNDPAVDHVLKGASSCLRRAGKPDGIDGYKSGSRTRVWALASAIWSAVASMRLSYSVPPASFEQHGQKIRTPSHIQDGSIATCLDTALLFAAALEQASLNPLIILTKGHAFVGLWLQPSEFSSVITDEPAALRRRFGLEELIVFETTLITQSHPPAFSQAIAEGYRQLDEKYDGDFEAAIDIRRARMQKIRPLGVSRVSKTLEEQELVVRDGLEEAPALSDFDRVEDNVAITPAGRVEHWQRKLLNLTTANRLLHLSDTAKAVRLICPDSGKLEDLLAAGKKIRIVPLPQLDNSGRDEKLYDLQTTSSLRQEVAKNALDRNEVTALLPKEKLDAQLIDLYRKSRSDLEEGGANTLFLAVGFLKWKKSEKETKVYRAPLILLPVKLERKSALSGMVMTLNEDEPRFNLTLLELLRQDFELTIPELEKELPRDESGIDVLKVLRLVRESIKECAGFEVVEDVALGTFSFAKYLMWKDLVERKDLLRNSPLVRHLIERDGMMTSDAGAMPRTEDIDKHFDPAQLFAPLPADSSQLVAVLASAQGRTFVLDGPPGTGKSQTIANMIAHNLALGRRILFVAEKRAALEVVHRRLADKGLAPFCLELHSSKATKSAVLQQLDAAWTTRDSMTADDWLKEASQAKSLRDRLNEVVALLHRSEKSGYTIHQAIGRYVRDGGENTPKFKFLPATRHGETEIARLRDVARQLGIARKLVSDLPAELSSVKTIEWSNGWQEAFIAAATAIPKVLDSFELAVAGLAKATQMPMQGDVRQQAQRLVDLAELCLAMHGHDMRFAFVPDMVEKIATARQSLALIQQYLAEEAALSATYAPEVAKKLDLEGLREAWALAGTKFWFLATLAKRKVAKLLAQSGGTTSTVLPEMDLPRLVVMRGLLEQIEALSLKASAIPGWLGIATQAADIESAIQRAEKLRKAIAAGSDSPEEMVALRRVISALVLDANEMLAEDGAIARAVSSVRHAMQIFDESSDEFNRLACAEGEVSYANLRPHALLVVAYARRLRDWANWQRCRDEAVQLELLPLVEGLEKCHFPTEDAQKQFETGYALWFAFHRMDAEPLLRNFMPGEHADAIERFRAIDDRMSELSTRYIRAKICGDIPDKEVEAKNVGYGLLRKQLQLQRPSMPIRKLASEMGEAFTRLAPCMLMSPLSIAQYLPPDQALFDVVIFDEASQITPWDAIGAMARGKQVIIAGDPRQMPPSNNFEKQPGAGSQDEETDEDMESILDECLAAGVPTINLDWHYRSRHESLITFSNIRYYEGRLVTFPSPDTRPSAVKWRRVDGVFSSGVSRTNAIEAQAIASEAVRCLLDPSFVDERGRSLSLGIITMNVEQMRLIEDLLDKARQKYPEIEKHFNADAMLEPVCVRNLETAQGDERDVILLGVNFGPTEPGSPTMRMTFGKLNQAGGWRRLNVAVTRARREMQIFTSFDPGMIDLARTSADGVRDLKAFIEFAQRGKGALAAADRGSLGGFDSPFEEAVAQELRRRGWQVVTQVGVSRFRIDLGIVHPDRPGDYLVGVECDGATYHSAATARDRDKVRSAILEGLGWTLVRVWSTDWWYDRERAAEKLHLAIEATLEKSRVDHEKAVVVNQNHMPPAEDIDSDLNENNGVRTPILIKHSMPAQYASSVSNTSALMGVYRFADISIFDDAISPDGFHESHYDEVLKALIDHIVKSEGPIAEGQLINRIARAHGFLRSGSRIYDRIMQFTRHQYHIASDGGREPFVWRDANSASMATPARFPASEEYIRQIEDIALAELRATGKNDPVEIARLFGVRRLSVVARSRIEMALQGLDSSCFNTDSSDFTQ